MNVGWSVVKDVPILQLWPLHWAVFAFLETSLIYGFTVIHRNPTMLHRWFLFDDCIRVKKKNHLEYLLFLYVRGHKSTRSVVAVRCGAVSMCYFIWEECLQSSKSTRPQGWGWRQAVMLSLRRKVAEKIQTHTERERERDFHRATSQAGFVRMTQLSSADKWWGKLSRPAQRHSSFCITLSSKLMLTGCTR